MTATPPRGGYAETLLLKNFPDNGDGARRSLPKTPASLLSCWFVTTNWTYPKQTIKSVLEQSFSHWELCIADDASENPALRGYLESLSNSDPRIRTCFRDQRGGICSASNSALELAQAPLVGPVDPGDLLGLNVLYEVMLASRTTPTAQLFLLRRRHHQFMRETPSIHNLSPIGVRISPARLTIPLISWSSAETK